jgi:hypothetical protein
MAAVSDGFLPRPQRRHISPCPQSASHHQDGCHQATAKFRHLEPFRLAAVKKEFQVMLHEGIICRSSSQRSSPLRMLKKKKDGSWWTYGNYRQLNLQTVEDKHPLLNMADLASRLDGCTIFSKLDICKGYLQVPVAAADVAKMAITRSVQVHPRVLWSPK